MFLHEVQEIVINTFFVCVVYIATEYRREKKAAGAYISDSEETYAVC